MQQVSAIEARLRRCVSHVALFDMIDAIGADGDRKLADLANQIPILAHASEFACKFILHPSWRSLEESRAYHLLFQRGTFARFEARQ